MAPCMLANQAALWASTGSPEMSVFHTLSAGKTGQPGAPGSGLPAEAAPPVASRDRPVPTMASTTAAVTRVFIDRLTSPAPTHRTPGPSGYDTPTVGGPAQARARLPSASRTRVPTSSAVTA